VDRGGKRHEMTFVRGIPCTELSAASIPSNKKPIEYEIIGLEEETEKTDEKTRKKNQKAILNMVNKLEKARKTGTSVTFLPDIAVFKGSDGKPGIQFDITRLQTRMDEVAYLNPDLVLTLRDCRDSAKENQMRVFYHSGGLQEYVQLLTASKTPLFGKKKKKLSDDPNVSNDGTTVIIQGSDDESGVSATIALKWSSDQYTESILSFCNNIRTKDGGSHVEGLRTSLTRTINSASRRLLKNKDNLPGECIREGLTGIISVSVPNPEFEGQTKGRLGNPEVRTAVDNLVSRDLVKVLDFHVDILEKIVSKAEAAQAATAAARAARELVRRKSLLTSTVLPGKLADCASRDAEKAEIFIVEGDSAAGSAKQGRNRQTQAILPLRGKILNIERASPEKIYQNAELQGLISALGLGVKGAAFDDNSLRYKKIIVMTDADVDGAHIRVLLLTFFYRYQKELVERGYVYIAQPPLYKIVISGKEHYVYNDQQKEQLIQNSSKTPSNIQRFKGLGEMMPNQLWSTTMDPNKRTLLQVTLEDAALADQMMNVLMGDAVGPRKDFITSHAGNWAMEDLDV